MTEAMTGHSTSGRRRVMSVIGQAGALIPSVEAEARALGRAAVTAGFSVATGGRDGVMEAASRGAREAPEYRPGDVIAVIPGYDHDEANAHADLVIPTGLSLARNVVLVAMADVVVAVAGGAGTLSEIALAWQLGRPVIALASTGGWAERLAGRSLDGRREGEVISAPDPQRAVDAALAVLSG